MTPLAILQNRQSFTFGSEAAAPYLERHCTRTEQGDQWEQAIRATGGEVGRVRRADRRRRPAGGDYHKDKKERRRYLRVSVRRRTGRTAPGRPAAARAPRSPPEDPAGRGFSAPSRAPAPCR